MGKAYQNSITLTAGFSPVLPKPIDDRLIVDTYADLAQLIADYVAYESMLVYVRADQKSYRLLNNTWMAQDIWSNITAVQHKNAFATNFPLGKVLFVQNEACVQYAIGSEVTVYPRISASDPNVIEYSVSADKAAFEALPGYWRVKGALTGGLLVQRGVKASDAIGVNTEVTLNSGHTCALFDNAGRALTWYWADITHTVLKSIPTENLKFYNINGIELTTTGFGDTNFRAGDVYSIAYPVATEPNDPTQVVYIKTRSQNNTEIDDIAILNLRVNTDGTGYVNRLGSNLFQNSTALEYVYLNENYNTYKDAYNLFDDKKSRINSYVFQGAKNLKEVYIPILVGKIAECAFKGTNNLQNLRNLTNSSTIEFEKCCLQDTGLTKLYLPKTLDKDTVITFKASAFENYNSTASTHLTTIFAHSPLFFDTQSFKFTKSGSTDYLNHYTMEIIYEVSREQVLTWLRDPNNNYVPFYRTSETITKLPDEAGLNLIDGSNGYAIGTATRPTIVYNYKEKELS